MRLTSRDFTLRFGITMFFLSAVYGIVMRWNNVYPLSGFPLNNVLQGHSHVAFLGWGYMVTIGVLLKHFINPDYAKKKIYSWCIAIIAAATSLMLISFITGGYGIFSIALLAVFGITSYVLSYRLLKDIYVTAISGKFIKFGIYYYVLSSLATWFLAGVIITQGKSDLYYNTVYFYLHFLYNGYFVFVLIGILLRLFEQQGLQLHAKSLKIFFLLLNIACIPTYFLSVLWSGVGSIFYMIGFIGSLIQMIALVYLYKYFRQSKFAILGSRLLRILIFFGLFSFGLKILLQFLSSFPYFVQMSLALKPFFIIGYLHLFTLGFMSVFLILILHKINYINLNRPPFFIGILLFLIGVLMTETLLFSQGGLLMLRQSPMQNYDTNLLWASLILGVGIFIMFVSTLILRKPD